MNEVAAVRHDATSLYKFIDSVAKGCADETHFSYTRPSQDFFAYISELGIATKRHISALSSRLDEALFAKNPKDFRRQAQEIATLRFAWYRLHKFIKPALDAHTLESPYSLVDALTQRLRSIPGFESVRFAIVHTSDLNYFQLQSTFLRQLVDQISLIVSSAPTFPKDLAIVGIPYSQATAVFLNTALAHEMGHFAFQLKRERDALSAELVSLLMSMQLANFTPEDITTCMNLVLDWLEEVYCDLFALYLAGPSFSFAFIDLLILTRYDPSRTFEPTHPANAVRLREQVKLLKDPILGWWDSIAASENHYVKTLEQATNIPDGTFTYGSGIPDGVDDVALRCFFSLLAKPKEAVLRTFANLESGVSQFTSQRDTIASYLSQGVVPSRLITDNGPEIPTSLSLLNATHLFYLDSLDTLLTKLATADINCLECRAYWADRVELWLAKALEDVNTNGYTVAIAS